MGTPTPSPDREKRRRTGAGIPWRDRLRAELAPSCPLPCLEEVGGGREEEGSGRHDADADEGPTLPLPSDGTVDIRRCLSPVRPLTSRPVPRWARPLVNRTPYLRLLFLGIAAHVLYVDVTRYPPHNLRVYFFYLTHWGHCLNVAYLLCSFSVGCGAGSTGQRQQQQELPADAMGGNDGARIDGSGRNLPRIYRLTWSLYATCAPLSLAVALLYWAAVAPAHTPDMVGYVAVMEHGGVGTLVLADGLLVGNVPVRARQFVFLLGVGIAYLAWSVVDYALDLGNGDWGPAYDDDALYPVLSWSREGRAKAAVVSGAALLVICPAAFGSVWMLGLASVETIEDADGDGEVDGGGDAAGGATTPRYRCCRRGCCGRRVVWDGRHRPLLGESRPVQDEHGALYCEMPAEMIA